LWYYKIEVGIDVVWEARLMSFKEMSEKDYLEDLEDYAERVRQRVAKSGLSLVDALILEGVDEKIASSWEKDLYNREDLFTLAAAYRRACVEVEESAAQRILSTGKANELISFLERRYPDRYLKKEKDEAPTVININLPEDLKDLAK
jgi:hypothetical protein